MKKTFICVAALIFAASCSNDSDLPQTKEVKTSQMYFNLGGELSISDETSGGGLKAGEESNDLYALEYYTAPKTAPTNYTKQGYSLVTDLSQLKLTTESDKVYKFACSYVKDGAVLYPVVEESTGQGTVDAYSYPFKLDLMGSIKNSRVNPEWYLTGGFVSLTSGEVYNGTTNVGYDNVTRYYGEIENVQYDAVDVTINAKIAFFNVKFTQFRMLEGSRLEFTFQKLQENNTPDPDAKISETYVYNAADFGDGIQKTINLYDHSNLTDDYSEKIAVKILYFDKDNNQLSKKNIVSTFTRKHNYNIKFVAPLTLGLEIEDPEVSIEEEIIDINL